MATHARGGASRAAPLVARRGARSYFELTAEVPEFMQGIALIASKTYSRGLIFILIYIESTFYIVIQSGEGDQPLLDVKVGFRDAAARGAARGGGSARKKEASNRRASGTAARGGGRSRRGGAGRGAVSSLDPARARGDLTRRARAE